MRKRIVERKEYAIVELAIPRVKTHRAVIMLSMCDVSHISTTSRHPISDRKAGGAPG
jgi:hypothetical protein